MSIKTSLPYLFAIAAVAGYGCSSNSNSTAPGTDGGGGGDGSTTSDGGEAGTGCGIDGAKDIVVTVVQYATPTNTPLSGAFVRGSTSGTCFQDTKTDDMGVAHLKLDPSKGPFDVTVALAGYTATSVLGVTESIPGNIVLDAIGAAATFKEFASTGMITGAAATNILQIDAWDWQTVVTKAGATSYTTKFEVSAGLSVPLPVSAIEVNTALTTGGLNAGTAINGTITSPITRPSAAATINITMPTVLNAPTMGTVKMNWPTTGLFTKASIKGAGAPVQDMHIGSGIVEKLTTSEAQAAMFCGIANVDPTDTGILHLQTFGGDMSPDIAGTEVSTVAPMGTATATDYLAVVYAHDLVNNPPLDIGPLTTMNITGTSLGDAMVEVESTGYDSAQLFINNSQGTTVTTIWVVYAPGGAIKPRGLPYLPGGVMLADLGGDVATASIDAQVVKYVKNGTSPWQSIVQDQSFLVGNAKATTLDPGGR